VSALLLSTACDCRRFRLKPYFASTGALLPFASQIGALDRLEGFKAERNGDGSVTYRREGRCVVLRAASERSLELVDADGLVLRRFALGRTTVATCIVAAQRALGVEARRVRRGRQ